ncbi:(2E,6E)-farnesyl diphosphate synthase [Algibacillus agarilyticus]|uniref:(2E,6E)-farnesyl diphosphate synthase n=1 Tax=Algibacillus agarilyticus TaxID=2234133 RepID=UPI000DCFCEB2|nr:farnesyl diphosphate synthase [Algibacillus agarilyticus]
MSLEQALNTAQQHIADVFDHYLSELPVNKKDTLHQAMAYSLTNGGKRIRPFLVFIVADILGLPTKDVSAAAAALEIIHCYSLVHDDLPAMDDDELRRGKPTCHIQFNEAQAILAGDALQPFAFEILATAQQTDAVKVKWVQSLAQAAGIVGMCGGQSFDLEAENKQLTLIELENIHNRKTGALLSCAIELACAAKPNLPPQEQQELLTFAKNIGLAYQVRDDILDVISSTEVLGKPQGSDVKLLKSTYPALMGLEEAQVKADSLYQEALEALSRLPYNTQQLADFAAYIVKRNY